MVESNLPAGRLDRRELRCRATPFLDLIRKTWSWSPPPRSSTSAEPRFSTYALVDPPGGARRLADKAPDDPHPGPHRRSSMGSAAGASWSPSSAASPPRRRSTPSSPASSPRRSTRSSARPRPPSRWKAGRRRGGVGVRPVHRRRAGPSRPTSAPRRRILTKELREALENLSYRERRVLGFCPSPIGGEIRGRSTRSGGPSTSPASGSARSRPVSEEAPRASPRRSGTRVADLEAVGLTRFSSRALEAPTDRDPASSSPKRSRRISTTSFIPHGSVGHPVCHPRRKRTSAPASTPGSDDKQKRAGFAGAPCAIGARRSVPGFALRRARSGRCPPGADSRTGPCGQWVGLVIMRPPAARLRLQFGLQALRTDHRPASSFGLDRACVAADHVHRR